LRKLLRFLTILVLSVITISTIPPSDLSNLVNHSLKSSVYSTTTFVYAQDDSGSSEGDVPINPETIPGDMSSDDSATCADGYHRSPSGDCELVTDTTGMSRCADGYHRSPSGDCERVGRSNTSNNINSNSNLIIGSKPNNNNNNNNLKSTYKEIIITPSNTNPYIKNTYLDNGPIDCSNGVDCIQGLNQLIT